METITEPITKDLDYKGFIEGSAIKEKSSGTVLCHYYGGVPYALPPVGPFRWRKPRSLPPCYRYGTRANPGRFTGQTGICPQPGRPSPLFDEDCVQCNIWVPVGETPGEGIASQIVVAVSGWPVLFYIHGGFLQFGSPNTINPSALLSETDCKCIIVAPGYRLNLFGFLASPELQQDSAAPDGVVGNYGFWDQRLALEWTYKNISYFGGDASNITVAGYSAGAHSAFHQLAYDLGLPAQKAIIRRLVMWSNGPGLQPKSLTEAQHQFDELLVALRIPLSLSPAEKLAHLRAAAPSALLKASVHMKQHQFRAVTDGRFVRRGLLHEISDGTFARRLRERGIRIMIGECRDEHHVYGSWRPPLDSLDSMAERLAADYPVAACEALRAWYHPSGQLTSGYKDWRDAFGRLYADVQIHMLQRGFVGWLARHGAGDLVHRYRIEWRATCTDRVIPKEWGVTHGTDMAIWFWGNGQVLSAEEKRVVWKGYLEALAKFLKGEEMEWGAETPRKVRRLTETGEVDVWVDEDLDKGAELWRVLEEATATKALDRAKL